MFSNFTTANSRVRIQSAHTEAIPNVMRRVGEMRAVSLTGNSVNSDRMHGAKKNATDYSDTVFGKIMNDGADTNSEAIFEFKDNILNIFDKIEG